MIDPVGAAQVVSSFQTSTYVGNTEVVSHVKHVTKNGATTVEEIKYATYNIHGITEPYHPVGSTLDITI